MISTHTIFSVPLGSLVAQSTSIQTQKAKVGRPMNIIISSGRPMDPNVVSPFHPLLLQTTQLYRRESGEKAYGMLIIFHSPYIHDEHLTTSISGAAPNT